MLQFIMKGREHNQSKEININMLLHYYTVFVAFVVIYKHAICMKEDILHIFLDFFERCHIDNLYASFGILQEAQGISHYLVVLTIRLDPHFLTRK